MPERRTNEKSRVLPGALSQFSILDAIRNAGRISRVEIANQTGQSRATVTNITADLLERGLLLEDKCQCPPSRGRRRIMLSLNPEAVFVVGVKLSMFQISFAVVDFVGNIKSSLIVPASVAQRDEEFIAGIVEDGVRHCLRDAKLRPGDVSAMGIGIPGYIDSLAGTCLWTPLNIEGSQLRRELSARLGVEVYLENDANALTAGEQWFGLGKDVDDFLVVTVEHGLGLGIVVNGKLYRGGSGFGAEFGHMVVVPGGRKCRCGKEGCLEAYVCDGSILSRAKEMLGRRKSLRQDVETLTISDVTAMARSGDVPLQRLFRESGDYLALGVAGLIQIFNPQRIIISGEGMRAGEMLIRPMQKSLKQYLQSDLAKTTELVIQDWGDDEWARGAAGFALSQIYMSPLGKTPSAATRGIAAGSVPADGAREKSQTS